LRRGREPPACPEGGDALVHGRFVTPLVRTPVNAYMRRLKYGCGSRLTTVLRPTMSNRER
ncbi:MAG: hypothetical protein Q8S27_10190, partial [Hoeflea sp.]|nr:hypothetical protein [Hoeflea sp.]